MFLDIVTFTQYKFINTHLSTRNYSNKKYAKAVVWQIWNQFKRLDEIIASNVERNGWSTLFSVYPIRHCN